MKSCIITLLLLLAGASLRPVAAQKHRYPLQKAEDIDTLFYLPPFSGIVSVGDDNRATYDEDVNDRARKKLQAVMDSLAVQTKLGTAIPAAPEQLDRIAAELTTLFNAARKKPSRYHELAIPPVTDSVLTASGKRFVMLVAVRGMTRSRENYREHNRRNTIIGVATLGMMIPVTTKNFMKMDVMIIDVPKRYIYYSKASPQLEGEPTSGQNLAALYRKLLGRLFWPGRVVNY